MGSRQQVSVGLPRGVISTKVAKSSSMKELNVSPESAVIDVSRAECTVTFLLSGGSPCGL
jgi:hypothetical protein